MCLHVSVCERERLWFGCGLGMCVVCGMCHKYMANMTMVYISQYYICEKGVVGPTEMNQIVQVSLLARLFVG